MNIPSRIGERYRCFIVIRDEKGWGGPYGQRWIPRIWRCEDCGHEIPDTEMRFDGPGRINAYAMARMADHHECGHAPCDRCGQMLLRRMDGTPRQHAHNRCSGKTPGDKVELEFVKNMTSREYA